MRRLIRENAVFFVPYFFLLSCCFIVQLWISSPELTFRINAAHAGQFDLIFQLFTDIGDGLTTILICGLLLFVSYGRALVLLVVSNLAGLLAAIIKKFITSPRPYLYFEFHHPALHFVPGVQVFRDHSFPSGHTTTAFSMAVLLVLASKNRAFKLFCLVLAICVGWSRIYLGEHFFADVVGGSLLGTVTSLVCLYFIQKSKLPEQPWFDSSLFTR